jgi:signal transduction histidine kinase
LACVRALRRPHAAAIETALLFGAFALIVVTNWVFGALGYTLPERVGDAEAILLLAVPYLLLRLIDRFLGVSRLAHTLSLIGFVVSSLVVWFFATPLPTVATLGVVVYFVLTIAYVTARYLRAARDLVGVSARRMVAISAGNFLLGSVLVIAGIQAVYPEASDVLRVISGLCGFCSGAAYFVGFTPPAWLRALWQEPELRTFLERSLAAADEPDIGQLVQQMEEGVAATVGVSSAFVAIWNEERAALEIRNNTPVQSAHLDLLARHGNRANLAIENGVVYSSPDAGLIGRAFSRQQPIFSDDPVSDAPEFAEAYRASAVQTVIVAPMSMAGEQFGVLGVYTPRPPLFASDDVDLVAFMARQAAAVFRSRKLLERVAALRAREQLTAQKDAFLAAVTHDLKTPVTAIRGIAQWVRRRATRGETVEIQALVDDMLRIEAASDRMNGLVNQLLDISRLQMGRPLELTMVDADLLQLTREVVEPFVQMTSRHKIAVACPFPELRVRCDPVRIERVLSNLVENAMKYSPQGGDIQVSLGPVEMQGGRPLVAIEVRDSGMGIPESDLPRIFQRFERGSNALHHGIAGTGIGLAYVLEVIDAHGGTVSVDSAESQGSTFTILLPVDRESIGSATSSATSNESAQPAATEDGAEVEQ